MLFRINYENFLGYMVDYFTQDEISSMQYMKIGNLRNQGTVENVVSFSGLCPNPDSVLDYAEYENLDLFRKSYMNELKAAKAVLFKAIVDPIMRFHHNIVIICRKDEDYFIDILCEAIKKYFGMGCINLNTLFEKGETDLFYLDREAMHDMAVDYRRDMVKSAIINTERTTDGRMELMKNMNRKQKIQKLRELGIRVNSNVDDAELDELMMAGYVIDG